MGIFSRMRLLATAGQGMVRGLPEASESRDPVQLFREWHAAADEAGLILPEGMALATSTPDGRPSVRMVLLKGTDERGFVFFTNYRSRKAVELDANPRASMCFHWGVLQRQVRVEGTVTRISPEESDAYFRIRSRGSRLGSWASDQSSPLDTRETLEKRFEEAKARFSDRDVPRPDHWGGYRLVPSRIEFWQGRADRLHDRLVFERSASPEGWSALRLYP